MIPAVLKIYADDESLLEYERSKSKNHCVGMDSISVRLMLMLRRKDMQMPDNYYDGICEEELTGINNISQLMQQIPQRIARQYIIRKGVELKVKGELFSEWMDVIVDVPPSLFIASSLLEVFHPQANDGIKKFAETFLRPFAHTSLLSPYLPDFDYWIKSIDGLEDLHIHLNGSTETDIIWRYMLAHPYESAKLIEDNEHKKEVKKLAAITTPNFNSELFLSRLKDAEILRIEMVRSISRRLLPNGTEVDQLHHIWGNWGVQSNYGPMIDEILFYLYVLNELRLGGDNQFASKFHHYLLIKGVIHRMVVMQHQQWGFEQFQSITIAPLRDGVERNYQRRFLQLSGTGCYPLWALMEGRFSPKKGVSENQKIINLIEKGWNKAQTILENEGKDISHSKLVLVAHFIKEPETNGSKKTFVRHSQLRNSLFTKAVALAETIKNPHYAKILRGIDAAASELDAGVEVFAPVFRYLRIKGIEHFTYHVGEDFRHLISGLRAIAEAMTFLELQRGDRLGHCVAVGIEPSLWAKRIHEHCFISQGELLDDLVFVWDLIRKEHNQILGSAQLSIESKIQELCYEVYGENYTPLELVKAWNLRKYDPYDYLNGLTTCSHYFKLEKGEERKNIETLFADKTLYDIMRKYHASIICPDYKQCRVNYDMKIKVHVGDILSMEQTKEIQRIVLREIATKGIVIETLPSSNLRIGYYKTMDEYHLTRWVATEDGTQLPPVVLGTDDPGIFMTNIYNEYARVFCHLQDKNLSVMDGIEKVKRIHETSKIYHFCQK